MSLNSILKVVPDSYSKVNSSASKVVKHSIANIRGINSDEVDGRDIKNLSTTINLAKYKKPNLVKFKRLNLAKSKKSDLLISKVSDFTKANTYKIDFFILKVIKAFFFL